MDEDPRRTIGRRGERIAARCLSRQGLRIVERNFRTRLGELDLVAANRDHLVFCEVKTRTAERAQKFDDAPFHPFASVGPVKQHRVYRMAELWIARRADALDPLPANFRFDVIGVTLNRRGRAVSIEHLPNAFDCPR